MQNTMPALEQLCSSVTSEPLTVPPAPTATLRDPKSKTPAQQQRELTHGSRSSSSAGTEVSSQSFHPWSFSAQHALKRFILSQASPKELSTKARALLGCRNYDSQMLQSVKNRASRLVRRGILRKLIDPWAQPSPLPSREDLAGVARRAFPRRMQLPVLVCDIYDNSGKLYCGKLGNIESYWKEMPEGVKIRWIHAPLGAGLMHSSVEDMFLHFEDPGRAFIHAGGHDFPHLEIDSIHFREKAELAHQRDVYNTLSGYDSVLSNTLLDDIFKDNENPDLERDLHWREGYRGKVRNFWTLVAPDIPLELSEHLSFQNHDGPIRPTGLDGKMEASVISRTTAEFREAQLVVAPFRCFHRSDGMLLTMSAATGVDLLHKQFTVDIKETLSNRLLNRDASVVGSTMRWLEERGANGWSDISVEWLMVYLVTEIAVTPTNVSSGRSATSVLTALNGAVLDLKERRHDEWQKDQTPRLVKDYITCADELHLLSLSCERKLKFLTRLALDLKIHREEDWAKHECGQTRSSCTCDVSKVSKPSQERVDWAASIVADNKAGVDFLLADINQALEALFQLRTIEQNECAIVTDLQNKVFFAFAAITVVFLPVSVFTSYFGMNLADLRDTNWTQQQFWTTLGTSAISFVVLVGIAATNYSSVYKWMDMRRSWMPRANAEEHRQRKGSQGSSAYVV